MDQQDFLQAIKNSLSNNEEIRKTGEEILLSCIDNPETIHLCFDILLNDNNEDDQFYSLVYAYKCIEKFWKMLEDEIQAEIRDMIMNILINITLSEKVTNILLDSVEYIVSNDETRWPELIDFIQSINDNPLCLMIVKCILLEMHLDDVKNLKEFIISLSISAMKSNEVNIQLYGVSIYDRYIVKTKRHPGSDQLIPALVEIVTNCHQFDIYQTMIVWSCVNDALILHEDFPEDVFMQIAEVAFQIGHDEEINLQIRILPIIALSPKINLFSEEMITDGFTMSIEIEASMIENDNIIDEETLEFFNSAAAVLDHESLYPIIQTQIQEAISSEFISYQVSGLLVFTTLLERFPDFVYNEVETILEFINSALSSEEELLIEASLYVLESFAGSFKSSNAYTPQFIPLILPNLVSSIPEICQHAFNALYNILLDLDSKLSDFLDQYLQISDQINPDDNEKYLSLMALVIDNKDDFTDEDCDQIINVISQTIENGDPEDIAACLQISVALLHQDESQIDFVTENMFPFIDQFLKNDDEEEKVPKEITNETFDFIGNIAGHLRAECYPLFEQYIPDFTAKIIQSLNDHGFPNEVKSGIVINSAKLAKFSGENAQEIIESIIPNIKDGLKSAEDDFQKQSAEAIIKIRRLLDPQTSQELFKDLIECLEEAPGYEDYINNTIRATAKLLVIADESNVELFVELTVKFIQSVLDDSWSLLEDIPLIQSPNRSDLFPSICQLFSAIFHYQTEINDLLCNYLIQLIEKNTEFDMFEIVGALSDCLEFKTVSDEMRQNILSSVIPIMDEANEPSLLQNLVFLVNILVQDEKASNLLPNIIELIPTFEKWRQIADNSKYGFQDVIANIASLYLQIALRVPDFEDNYIVFSIEQFPPYDINETSSMAEAIMNLVKSKQSDEIVEQAALAFIRFFVQEDSKIDKAKIRDELKAEMIDLLKEICSDDQMFTKIKSFYGKQRSKIRKIEALLNSE